MSGLEVPGILLAVAGLFSSCVDAFAYFKLAQCADREVEVALLKLDVEKARLLIWGNEMGIFSTGPQRPQLLDERVIELIQDILSQVETLLTDSETLRTSYGMRTLETPLNLNRVVDYVSSKSLAVFRISASRFWARNASRLSGAPRRNNIARTRWAIYERERFQGLVNDVKHFVDSLFDLVKITREIPDRVIVDDIESILNVSHLSIVEEATEDSYRVYSEAAASARTSTETGSIDRRTLEERLRDVAGNVGSRPNNVAQTFSTPDSEGLMTELTACTKYFVLTSECRKVQTQHPCDVRYLGPQVVANSTSNDHVHQYNVSSRCLKGGNSLGQLTKRLIGIGSKIRDHSLNWSPFLDETAPLIVLYIYCPPCVCLIHTALAICAKVSSDAVDVFIRPDDRLAATCCSTVDRTLGLRSVLDWVRQWEARATMDSYSSLAKYLDNVWIDCRLDHLYYEQPYTYLESSESRAMILGETAYLTPLLQRAPGRIPKPTDIWILNTGNPNPQRIFFGRFIESQLVDGDSTSDTQPTPMQLPTPEISPWLPTVVPDPGRPPSLTSSDGNQRQTESGQVVVGGNETEADDEEAESRTPET
ncbi:hypothetical protein DL767_009427 [Monosporascus sp. MG133]|nr:hypothetical protein DL767_009427 [Monosporascus sp. MG133]